MATESQFTRNKTGTLFCRQIDVTQKNRFGEPGKVVMVPIGELVSGTAVLDEQLLDAREFRPVYLEQRIVGEETQ